MRGLKMWWLPALCFFLTLGFLYNFRTQSTRSIPQAALQKQTSSTPADIRNPASIPTEPSLKVQSSQYRKYLDPKDSNGRILIRAFELAAIAGKEPAKFAELERFAIDNYKPEGKVVELVQYGLKSFPQTPEFALERAGLLAILEKFGPRDEVTGEIFAAEVHAMKLAPRPNVSEARSQEERNQALSLGLPQAQVEIAISGWINRQTDFQRSSRELLALFHSVPDPMLRQQLYRAVLTKWSGEKVALEQLLSSAGLPVDEIRYN